MNPRWPLRDSHLSSCQRDMEKPVRPGALANPGPRIYFRAASAAMCAANDVTNSRRPVIGERSLYSPVVAAMRGVPITEALVYTVSRVQPIGLRRLTVGFESTASCLVATPIRHDVPNMSSRYKFSTSTSSCRLREITPSY